MEEKCKSVEDKLKYFVESVCDRVKKKLELTVQDVGQSMVDYLKRRD